jgi:hypothetical protein
MLEKAFEFLLSGESEGSEGNPMTEWQARGMLIGFGKREREPPTASQLTTDCDFNNNRL